MKNNNKTIHAREIVNFNKFWERPVIKNNNAKKTSNCATLQNLVWRKNIAKLNYSRM